MVALTKVEDFAIEATPFRVEFKAIEFSIVGACPCFKLDQAFFT